MLTESQLQKSNNITLHIPNPSPTPTARSSFLPNHLPHRTLPMRKRQLGHLVPSCLGQGREGTGPKLLASDGKTMPRPSHGSLGSGVHLYISFVALKKPQPNLPLRVKSHPRVHAGAREGVWTTQRRPATELLPSLKEVSVCRHAELR